MLPKLWISVLVALSTINSATASNIIPIITAPAVVEVRDKPAPPRPAGRSLKQATRNSVVNRATLRSRRRLAERAGSSPVSSPSTVTVDSTVINGDATLTRFYTGYGYTENDINPTDTDTGTCQPIQTTFPSSTSQNDAITDCAQYAVNQGCSDAAGNGYYYTSFQVYYLAENTATPTGPGWICRAYNQPDGAESDETYFNVANPDAGPVFGYQA